MPCDDEHHVLCSIISVSQISGNCLEIRNKESVEVAEVTQLATGVRHYTTDVPTYAVYFKCYILSLYFDALKCVLGVICTRN